uniref:Ion channel n=1 Tax=Alexandrium monilatum TaxID=311494 RepID=A0A7S4V5U9_9DINO
MAEGSRPAPRDPCRQQRPSPPSVTIHGRVMSDAAMTPLSPGHTGRSIMLLQSEDRIRKLKTNTWNLMDFLLGTRRGQILGLFALFLILMFSGAGAWHATGGYPDMYGDTFSDSLWFSWGMFFDPGTQMGFPADSDVKFKVIAVIFSIFGFTYNLLILGLIVEGARIGLDTLHKRRNRLVCNGHSLILGWSEKTLFLLKEMAAASLNRGVRNKIVILAEEDELVMWNEIRRHFPKASERKHYICRRGCPYECDDLMKASAVSAHDIVILGSMGRTSEADLDAVRIMVALAALTERPSGNIIAEVRSPASAAVIRSILDGAEGMIARDPVNRVLSIMANNAIIGDVYLSLLSFVHGEELYCKNLKDMAPEVASCKTFGQVGKALKHGICVGVDPPDGSAIMAPSDDYIISAQDRLIVLAHSESLLKSQGVTSWTRGSTTDDPDSNVVKTRVTKRDTERQTLIIIGWSTDMADRLLMLDQYTPKGTEVHHLCEKSIEDREARLEASLAGTQFINIQLAHHTGSTTSLRKLAKLPLAQAFAVLVLADERCQDKGTASDSAAENDSASLACVVTLKQLCKGEYQQYLHCKSEARIICEVLDPRTQRVLSKGGQLSEAASFFFSTALETGIFAMASSEPVIFNTVLLLLEDNDRGDIMAKPVEEYVKFEDPSRDCDIDGPEGFWTLWNAVREKDEVLMGWHLSASNETVLNPDKTSPTGLQPGDQVIVASKGMQF